MLWVYDCVLEAEGLRLHLSSTSATGYMGTTWARSISVMEVHRRRKGVRTPRARLRGGRAAAAASSSSGRPAARARQEGGRGAARARGGGRPGGRREHRPHGRAGPAAAHAGQLGRHERGCPRDGASRRPTPLAFTLPDDVHALRPWVLTAVPAHHLLVAAAEEVLLALEHAAAHQLEPVLLKGGQEPRAQRVRSIADAQHAQAQQLGGSLHSACCRRRPGASRGCRTACSPPEDGVPAPPALTLGRMCAFTLPALMFIRMCAFTLPALMFPLMCSTSPHTKCGLTRTGL